MNTKLFKTSYVAQALDVCKASVLRQIREGRIAAVRIGGALRVSEQELKRILREGTTPRA